MVVKSQLNCLCCDRANVSSFILPQILFSSLTPCVTVALRHLIRLVREHRIFKEVFHDVGLLELGVELLHRFADTLSESDNAQRLKQEGRSSAVHVKAGKLDTVLVYIHVFSALILVIVQSFSLTTGVGSLYWTIDSSKGT